MTASSCRPWGVGAARGILIVCRYNQGARITPGASGRSSLQGVYMNSLRECSLFRQLRDEIKELAARRARNPLLIPEADAERVAEICDQELSQRGLLVGQ